MENRTGASYNDAGPVDSADTESPMAKVVIYTTAFCPYCHRAKALLEDKGVAFEEIDVTFNPSKRAEMSERAGRSTVPQIWIDGQHVGGSDELAALDAAGKLDPLLGRAA